MAQKIDVLLVKIIEDGDINSFKSLIPYLRTKTEWNEQGFKIFIIKKIGETYANRSITNSRDIEILDSYLTFFYKSNIIENIKQGNIEDLGVSIDNLIDITRVHDGKTIKILTDKEIEGIGLPILYQIIEQKLEYEIEEDMIDLYYRKFQNNWYTEMGGNPIITLLGIKRLNTNILPNILNGASFFGLIYDMIEKGYMELDATMIINRIQDQLQENDIEIFDSLLQEVNNFKNRGSNNDIEPIIKEDDLILNAIKDIKSKYGTLGLKSYIKNYNLTIKDIIQDEYVNFNAPLNKEYIISNLQANMLQELTTEKVDSELLVNGNDPKSIIYTLLSQVEKGDTEDTKYLARIIIMEQETKRIRGDINVFRMVGPVNPRTDIDTLHKNCYKYGGCRMFICRCRSMLDDYSDELINEEEGEDWFKGYCEFCSSKIDYRVNSIRKPNLQGGWDGCYCSPQCASDSIIFISLESRIKMESIGEDKKLKPSMKSKLLNIRLESVVDELKTKGIQKQLDD